MEKFSCNESEVYCLSFLVSHPLIPASSERWWLITPKHSLQVQHNLCVFELQFVFSPFYLSHLASDLGNCSCCTQNPSLGKSFIQQKALGEARKSWPSRSQVFSGMLVPTCPESKARDAQPELRYCTFPTEQIVLKHQAQLNTQWCFSWSSQFSWWHCAFWNWLPPSFVHFPPCRLHWQMPLPLCPMGCEGQNSCLQSLVLCNYVHIELSGRDRSTSYK